jgi:LAO/AO transport system kinase
MKKGILELADGIAINKADGDNVKRAERARKDYENALHYLRPATPTWAPPVLTCSAKDESRPGIRKIWETVLLHREKLSATAELEEKRKHQAVDWMWDLIKEGLQERFQNDPNVKRRLAELQRAVADGRAAPTAAAAQLLFLLDKEKGL